MGTMYATTNGVTKVTSWNSQILPYHTWSTLGANTSGDPITIHNTAGAVGSVQMSGTFGGSMTMQMSNDGVNWHTMLDLSGYELVMAAAGMKDFSTAAKFIRPTAGTGVTSVTVSIVLRG